MNVTACLVERFSSTFFFFFSLKCVFINLKNYISLIAYFPPAYKDHQGPSGAFAGRVTTNSQRDLIVNCTLSVNHSSLSLSSFVSLRRISRIDSHKSGVKKRLVCVV